MNEHPPRHPATDLLRALERDPRLRIDQLAVMTGRSEDDTREALAGLERDGVILGYRTSVNWEKAGAEEVAALIEVSLTPQRDAGFDKIAARIYRYPEVHSVWLVSGTYDLSIMVVSRSMRGVSQFVSEKLATIDGVRATVTHFILKRYKEDGFILEGIDEKPERLAVSP